MTVQEKIDLILKNQNDILAILRGEVPFDYRSYFDSIGMTKPISVDNTMKDKDAFEYWWKPMFESPIKSVFDFGDYGTFTHIFMYERDVLMWDYDGLNDSPEIFGLPANIPALSNDKYPMFDEVLSEMFGDNWLSNYKMPSQNGVTTHQTGLPVALFECGIRKFNGLK